MATAQLKAAIPIRWLNNMPKLNINGVVVKVPDDFNNLNQMDKDRYVDDITNSMASEQAAAQNEKAANMMPQIEQIGHYLEQHDLKNAVDNSNPLTKFGASAGVQTQKMYQGVKDLFDYGNDEETRRLEQLNTVLTEDSPVSNFTGRMTGGVLNTVPLMMASSTAIPGALGLFGRMLLSGVSGGVEGFLEKPFSNESRAQNTAMGAAFGFGAEPIMTALQYGFKQIPFGAMYDKVTGSTQISRILKRELSANGVNYDSLKPETRKVLESVSRSEDVDRAIKDAMETEYGFKLTGGEHSGDFAQISAEQSAMRQSQEAGDLMRNFKDQQNTDIINKSEQIAEEAGGNLQNNQEQIGASLKQALDQTKKGDKAKYQALYGQAKLLSEQDGIDIPLDNDALAESFYKLADANSSTNEALLYDIGRHLARIGVLDPKDFPANASFKLPDVDVANLSVATAEDFIIFLNKKFDNNPQTSYIIGELKDRVSQLADDAIAKGLKGTDSKAADIFLKTAREARAANKNYRGLWESKDILNELTGFKPGTDTPLKTASDVVKRITRNPEDTKKVIEQLKRNGNLEAIADLRTFVLKDLFDNVINPNVPKGDFGFFSPNKLSSLIKKNNDVLKAVLDPDQYSQLKGFEASLNKTKPPEGAVNHSNTASKIADMLFGMASHIPFNPMGALREHGATQTVKKAISQKRMPVDHILKLDKNHIKLNALLRQFANQTQQKGALTEEEE